MQSQAIINQTQAQISHKQNQAIVQLEVQIAAPIGEREERTFPLSNYAQPERTSCSSKYSYRPVRNWFWFKPCSPNNPHFTVGKRVDNQVQDPPNSPKIVKKKKEQKGTKGVNKER